MNENELKKTRSHLDFHFIENDNEFFGDSITFILGSFW